VRIDIVNSRGETVDVVADRRFERGGHQAVWNAGSFASGVYFCRLRFDSYVATRKMILAR
jgi:hypothetical protein